GKKGKEGAPELENITYTEDKQSIIITMSLEAGKEYEFILVGKAFRGENGLGIKDYPVKFTTRAKR
ncbi:MAG: hypothetical protein AAF705_12030, partial [Bacteroidota bacterium]